MRTQRGLAETTAQAVVSGRVPPERPDLADLAAFAVEVRALGDGPVPAPGGRLTELLDAGLATGIVDGRAPEAVGRRGRGTMRTKGLAAAAAKTGAGVAVAMMALTGAAVADALPQQAQDRVAAAVEALSPANLPDSKDNNRGGVSEEKKHHGRDAHQKAKNSPAATATARIPIGKGRPASPGQKGLDQANSGPAAGRAPTAVPAPGANRPTARPAPASNQSSARPSETPGDRPTAAPGGRPTAAPGGQGRPSNPGSQGRGRPAPEQTTPSATPTG